MSKSSEQWQAPPPRIPTPTPPTQAYFKAATDGEFLIQKCTDCAEIYFPPRPFCPVCLSRQVEWIKASGKASLYSYVINQRDVPGWPAPQSVAMVKLEEGPMMVSCIVECEQTPEALVIDMPLQVTFRQLDENIAIPVFKPGIIGESA